MIRVRLVPRLPVLHVHVSSSVTEYTALHLCLRFTPGSVCFSVSDSAAHAFHGRGHCDIAVEISTVMGSKCCIFDIPPAREESTREPRPSPQHRPRNFITGRGGAWCQAMLGLDHLSWAGPPN